MVRTATKKKPEPVVEQVALPIDDATVQERQVAIRVLTLGTRQITQTLYRQIVEEDVIDGETGCLRGSIWGWVNLHDKDCDELGGHHHVIWEDNEQLKRSCSLFSCRNDYYKGLMSELARMSVAYACFVALANKKFPGQEDNVIHLTIKGVHMSAHIPREVVDLWQIPGKFNHFRRELADVQAKGHESDFMRFRKLTSVEERVKDLQSTIALEPERVASAKQQVMEQARDALKVASLDPVLYTSHDQIYAKMETLADEIATFEQNWKKSYKAIKDAGQLFVAVSGVWK